MTTSRAVRSLWLAGVSVALLLGCEERTEPTSATPATGEAAMREAVSEMPSCCPVPGAEVAQVATTQPTTQPAESPATQPATQATEPVVARAGEWLAPEKRDKPFYLNFDVTDQSGQAMKMSQLVGKPIALTFLFTRCPNPQMCPMIAAGLAHLQRATVAAGIDQQVQLLAVSYDPGYDTPERLKAYGERFGMQWTNVKLLRPTMDQFRDLIGEFAIDVRGTADGNINHRIELILIDKQGRYVRDYQAAIWDSKSVVEDLGKLVAEGPGPVASTANP